MTKIKTLDETAAEIVDCNSGLTNPKHFHGGKIVLCPSSLGKRGYFIESETFCGPAGADRTEQESWRHFLSCAGYYSQRTMRHPINGEWSVYSGQGDNLAYTQHEEVADSTAYAFAREIGIAVAKKFGLPFEDRVKS